MTQCVLFNFIHLNHDVQAKTMRIIYSHFSFTNLTAFYPLLLSCVYLRLSLRHQRSKTKSRTRRLQISLSERWALCQIGLYELMLWLQSSALARWVYYLLGCLPCPNWDTGVMPRHPDRSLLSYTVNELGARQSASRLLMDFFNDLTDRPICILRSVKWTKWIFKRVLPMHKHRHGVI